MIWAIYFALAVLVSVLKGRYELAAASALGFGAWLLVIPWAQDELPDLLTFALALALLCVPSAALIGDHRDGSPWDRLGLEPRVSFGLQLLGSLLLVGCPLTLAILFATHDVPGGAIAMGIFAAGVAYAFLPMAFASRPRRQD